MKTFELDVQEAKLRILRAAQIRNTDSAVLVAAMADVLGIIAATLDRQVGAQDFDSRLDPFASRAKSAYHRALSAQETFALLKSG